jgi:hypothetical protein
MSLLAELYVSRDDQEATRYDSEPSIFTDREQYTSFTELELSTLWAKMRGIDWDSSLVDGFRPSVLLEDGGERTIHRLPEAMTGELAGLTPEQISTAATKWAATDELACEPSNVQPIIEGLVRLVKNATETGRSIYLWNCV